MSFIKIPSCGFGGEIYAPNETVLPDLIRFWAGNALTMSSDSLYKVDPNLEVGGLLFRTCIIATSSKYCMIPYYVCT